ncbi:hypothetical protein [Pelomonas sp. KK5]|uniref:hypothetical protein n=1 Tax=Pelomonas sp. KK5 TaxID=1855730 RepID=UPI00097C2F62|nr:hypothetical protein [Pelomonas sp. KK5]
MRSETSAREALIAELIGDLSQVLALAQTLIPAMAASRKDLMRVHAELTARLAAELTSFDARMLAMTERARRQTAAAIAESVGKTTQRTVEAQKLEIRETAQAVFGDQANLTLQRLAAATQRLAEQRRSLRDQWLWHLVTASVTFALSGPLAIWMWWRWTSP